MLLHDARPLGSRQRHGSRIQRLPVVGVEHVAVAVEAGAEASQRFEVRQRLDLDVGGKAVLVLVVVVGLGRHVGRDDGVRRHELELFGLLVEEAPLGVGVVLLLGHDLFFHGLDLAAVLTPRRRGAADGLDHAFTLGHRRPHQRSTQRPTRVLLLTVPRGIEEVLAQGGVHLRGVAERGRVVLHLWLVGAQR